MNKIGNKNNRSMQGYRNVWVAGPEMGQ